MRVYAVGKVAEVTTSEGLKFRLDCSHTEEEWKKLWGGEDEFWSFPIEELLDGTIEPNNDHIYWLIDGRAYETTAN